MTHYPSRSKIYHIKSDSLDSSKINKDEAHSISVAIKPPIITTPHHQNQNNHKMPENNTNPNPLSGLLGQYDSDSDHETTTVNGQESSHKLDAKVDNFLQEINQIAPELNKTQKPHIAWQECFDESTGYPYYWNVETNAVTWEMPPEYKLWLTQTNKQTVTNKATIVPEFKPEQQPQKNETKPNNNETSTKAKTKIKKKIVKKKAFDDAGSSDDERIVMITSFSEDSLSESENEKSQNEDDTKKEIVMGPYIEDIPKLPESTETKKEIIEKIKDENIDETVILARLRTQAKVLHELGGELPKSVDKTILSITEKLDNKPQSLCLVAGYGEDSDHSDADENEDQDEFKKTIFPIPELKDTTVTNNEAPLKESTLFPVTVPIDVKQFEIPETGKQMVEMKDANEELIDNKAFKRKKRLGLTFDVKKSRIEDSDDLTSLSENRKGFGFQATSSDSSNSNSVKKGGIAFIKADILNSNESSNNSETKDAEDFMEIKNIVTEKVNFLGEGKDPVSAVQIMSIQLQTLEAAYNVQALTKAYLYAWLRETFTGLEKLEQEATPEGWTCQWDRSHKRYFYRNTATGETQWHYPAVDADADVDVDAADADIVGGGEAMDICTTPPPNEDIPQPEAASARRKGIVVTPSPPRIQNSPSPPPPPCITTTTITTTNNDGQPPIPTAPPPPDEVIPPPPPTISESQPLPPGVDTSELPYFAAKLKEKEMAAKANETAGRDSLGSELDSFYSDIAQLEACSQGSVPETVETKSVSSPSSSIGENPIVEGVKKKKKSKQKIGQGINMKKKAVSSLVEKWKKVQNDY